MQAPPPTLTPQTQPAAQAPGQAAAQPPMADPAYGPAVGLSLKEKEQVRQLEGIAAEKTARDYQHIVLAYGVLWALFAGYGIFLWRRSARLRADMDDLRRTLDRRP